MTEANHFQETTAEIIARAGRDVNALGALALAGLSLSSIEGHDGYGVMAAAEVAVAIGFEAWRRNRRDQRIFSSDY